MDSIFFPGFDITAVKMKREYKDYLVSWYSEFEVAISKEEIAMSELVQAFIIAKVCNIHNEYDWLELIDSYLTDKDDGHPLNYSEKYGKKLYKFTPWKQKTVYAIYNQWWISRALNKTQKFDSASVLESYIQPSGWIYNPNSSDTSPKYRMKSELFFSMLMGLTLLKEFDSLKKFDELFFTTLSSAPLTPYLSAELFRVLCYEKLGRTFTNYEHIKELLNRCITSGGFIDFTQEEKRDDYMGTKKRVSRDTSVSSPLISLYAFYLINKFKLEGETSLSSSLQDIVIFLEKNPFSIKAQGIRDLDFDFGPGITPVEVIASSLLTSSL